MLLCTHSTGPSCCAEGLAALTGVGGVLSIPQGAAEAFEYLRAASILLIAASRKLAASVADFLSLPSGRTEGWSCCCSVLSCCCRSASADLRTCSSLEAAFSAKEATFSSRYCRSSAGCAVRLAPSEGPGCTQTSRDEIACSLSNTTHSYNNRFYLWYLTVSIAFVLLGFLNPPHDFCICISRSTHLKAPPMVRSSRYVFLATRCIKNLRKGPQRTPSSCAVAGESKPTRHLGKILGHKCNTDCTNSARTDLTCDCAPQLRGKCQAIVVGGHNTT